MKKRLISALLCLCMLVTLLPGSAFATNESRSGSTSTAQSGSESAAQSDSESAAQSDSESAAQSGSESAAQSGSESTAQSGSTVQPTAYEAAVALFAALPAADSLTTETSAEAAQAIYDQLAEAMAAYDTLSEDEQAQLEAEQGDLLANAYALDDAWRAYNGQNADAPATYTDPNPTTEMADFANAANAAIALLNQYKTSGATDSTWDTTTKTLTLNGIDFTTSAAIAVQLPSGATIVVNGENTITAIFSKGENTKTIWQTTGLFIQNTTDEEAKIKGTGQLVVKSGSITTTSAGVKCYSTGISRSGPIRISGSVEISATAGSVTAADSCGSTGFYANALIMEDTSSLIATAGDATNTQNSGYGGSSDGVETGRVTIDGANTVTATAGTTNESHGLHMLGGAISISNKDAKVTCKGGIGSLSNGSRPSSAGIYIDQGGCNITVSAGELSASGGECTTGESVGIYAGRGRSLMFLRLMVQERLQPREEQAVTAMVWITIIMLKASL